MKRNRYFQWIDGELSGTVEMLLNITETEGEYFYNFSSGESCNMRFISKMTNSPAMLKDKFMVEIASPNDPWIAHEITVGKFKNAGTDEIVDVPPLEDITGASGTGNSINIEKSKLGTKKFTPPRYKGPYSELPSLDEYFVSDEPVVKEKKVPFVASMIKKKPAAVQPPVEEQPGLQAPPNVPIMQTAPAPYMAPSAKNTERYEPEEEKNDPVKILAKTCKKRETDIDLTITISLPSKSVYTIAESEFDNGGEKFINYLIKDIDVNEIISSIKQSLIDLYSNGDSE